MVRGHLIGCWGLSKSWDSTNQQALSSAECALSSPRLGSVQPKVGFSGNLALLSLQAGRRAGMCRQVVLRKTYGFVVLKQVLRWPRL